MKLIVVLFFVLQFKAYAACTPKDLSDPDYLRSVGKENLIDHFKSPRDQDSVGWCGAYGPSDSLSFAVGEAVSAVDVSINQYANEKQTVKLQELSGISPLAAIEVAKTNGYCPESVIPSDQASSSNLGHYAILNLMTAFQKISEDFKAKGMPQDYCISCKMDEYEKTIKPTLPNVTTDMIKNVLIKYRGDGLASLRELLKNLCEGSRKKIDVDYNLIQYNWQVDKHVAKDLDEALDNNSMPSIGMSTKYFATDEAVPGGHGGHELMVVARRPGPNGKCEYEIRNSWGKSCSFYIKKVAEKCDDEKGSFWMSQDDLQIAVDDVLVIKNKKNKVTNPIPPEPKPIKKNEDTVNGGSAVTTLDGGNNNFSANNSNGSSSSNENTQSTDNSNNFSNTLNEIGKGIGNAISSLWQGLASLFHF